jgi:RNA polymerase sigma factor (sigma-70 family)
VTESIDDLEERACEGDSEAFSLLIRRFDRDLRGTAWSVVQSSEATDDVMQAAYERAFRSIGTFNRDSALKTWLHTICYRTAIDHLRYESRRRHVSIEEVGDLPSGAPAEQAVNSRSLAWQSVSSSRRRRIRAAKKRLEVQESDDVNLFLRLNNLTFARQGRRASYTNDDVRRLDAVCARRGARRILLAVDEEGNPHSAEYLVSDSETTYDLMSGTDPRYRSSDAGSLLVWEAIVLAAATSKSLNFSGGSLTGSSRFWRASGLASSPT